MENQRPGTKENLALRAKPGLSPGAAARAARKEAQGTQQEVRRLEREIDRLARRETTLHEQMTASATDHGRLAELQTELEQVVEERERVETSWLEASE